MSFDLSNERVCPHQIFDEQLTLQGASPSYFAPLKYFSNANTHAIEIREFATTNSLTNYTYTINGFTNWSLSSDGRQVNFNSSGLGGPGTGVASFADGTTIISPYIYLITYLTTQDRCPLHDVVDLQRSPVQRDVYINPQGRLTVVVGEDKVRQEVLKVLETTLGSNRFQPDYGSLIPNSVGQKLTLLTQFTLQQSIQDAIDFLIQQQQQDPSIPINELILRLTAVNMEQDTTDPRVLRARITILTGSFKEVVITFGVVTQ